jgi:hypothetical protein
MIVNYDKTMHRYRDNQIGHVVWAQEVLPRQDVLAVFWDFLANEYFPWLKEGSDKTHGLTERGLNVADRTT